MSSKDQDPQIVYAVWLALGTRLVFGFALVALALYLTGILEPTVPLAELPRLWKLPAAEVLRQGAAPGKWEWLRLLHHGDYLSLLAIAFFALVSLVCSARVAFAFRRRGEKLQALVALLQVLVLLAAAADVIPAG